MATLPSFGVEASSSPPSSDDDEPLDSRLERMVQEEGDVEVNSYVDGHFVSSQLEGEEFEVNSYVDGHFEVNSDEDAGGDLLDSFIARAASAFNLGATFEERRENAFKALGKVMRGLSDGVKKLVMTLQLTGGAFEEEEGEEEEEEAEEEEEEDEDPFGVAGALEPVRKRRRIRIPSDEDDEDEEPPPPQ